jgi:heme-degrading monooxygenase HmoA
MHRGPRLRPGGDNGYAEAARRMEELAAQQPGFLGFETARQEIGISVSYWASLAAIRAWKEQAEHLAAQGRARDWYRVLRVRVCRVEKEYGYSWPAASSPPQQGAEQHDFSDP